MTILMLMLIFALLFGATVLSNTGKAIITNRMRGSGTEPLYVGWGTGAGTALVTDVDLFTPSVDEARSTGVSTQQTTSVTNDTYQVIGTITCAANNKTITNAALFDASSAGNIFMKGDFTGVAVSIGDAIQFTVKLQFT